MKKLTSKQLAINILIVGGILLALSYIVSLVTLFVVYDMASLDDAASTSGLSTLKIITKLNVYAAYFGYAVMGIGLFILALSYYLHSKKS